MSDPDTPLLFLNRDMSECELIHVIGGLAAFRSVKAPYRKDEPNEDAAAWIPFHAGSGILAVADGAGGMKGGDQASALAIKCMRESLKKAAEEEVELRTAILDGFERANEAINNLAIGAATTLAVVEIQGDTVRPYHVGDSMIMAFGQRGKLKLQTVSHSPVGYAVEAGMLDQDEALVHEERHIVSNLLGTPDMSIEIGSSFKLAPHDTLLIGSDGLYDNMTIDEIVSVLRSGELAKGVFELTEKCSMRMSGENGSGPGKPDDLTILVFRPGKGPE